MFYLGGNLDTYDFNMDINLKLEWENEFVIKFKNIWVYNIFL